MEINGKETLEEVFNIIDDEKCRYSTEESEFWHHYKIGVLDGLKWKEQRSYSEEDMYWAMNMAKGFTDSGKSDVDIRNHFEQFKKK